MSDHTNSTASDAFSQANCHEVIVNIVFVFSYLFGRARVFRRMGDHRCLECENPFLLGVFPLAKCDSRMP